MAKPITVQQLLNLADRAERGPLTQAEADRLRAGIAALHDNQRFLETKTRTQGRRVTAVSAALLGTQSELRGIHRLIARAKRRGEGHIPLWQLEALIDDDINQEAA
ncbi:hypothetical protein [Streptomyces hydrogenans]